jgi:alkaline phosphatase D
MANQLPPRRGNALPGAVDRRWLIQVTGGVAAAIALSGRPAEAAADVRRLAGYPFSLGVASGDPAPDGVVLWTRLAPRPTESGGGMPRRDVPVRWQVAKLRGIASDARMQRPLTC